MAQCRKAARKFNRDRVPCSVCGQDHPTWQHGKSPDEIARQRISRERNPRDPRYVEPEPKPEPKPAEKPVGLTTLVGAVAAIAAGI
jgi:hypothetical protein